MTRGFVHGAWLGDASRFLNRNRKPVDRRYFDKNIRESWFFFCVAVNRFFAQFLPGYLTTRRFYEKKPDPIIF